MLFLMKHEINGQHANKAQSASLALRQHAECFNRTHSNDLTDLPTKQFSKA